MTGSIGRVGVAAALALATHLGMQARGGVHVCVGADRVLRHQTAGKCPTGTTEFYLAEEDGRIDGEPAADEPEAKGEVAELRRQVATLRRQLADLQRSLATRDDAIGARVVAPFVVVDPAGKPILSVRAEPRSLVMTTGTGEDVIFVSALASGGFFKARSKSASREAVIGVDGEYGAVELRGGGGAKRAVLALQDDNNPILGLRNGKGISVAALMAGGSGAGKLQLGDEAGNTTVDAGTTTKGVGLVRAYPVGSPGAGLVGMPGTFIIGRR